MQASNPLLATILLGALPAAAFELAVGDTLAVSATYVHPTGMSGGQTNAKEVVTSILTRGDTTFYQFQVASKSTSGFFEDGSMMVPLINVSTTQLAILSAKPSSIAACSPRFEHARWILPELSTLYHHPHMQPATGMSPLPLDTVVPPYALTDSFVVRLSDTAGIRWKTDSFGTPSSFIGTYLRFANARDSIGTPIAQRGTSGAACTELLRYQPSSYASAATNAFTFNRVYIATGTTPSLLGRTPMGAGCYGTAILGHKPGPVLGIGRRSLRGNSSAGQPPYRRTVDLDGKSATGSGRRSSGVVFEVGEDGSVMRRLQLTE